MIAKLTFRFKLKFYKYFILFITILLILLGCKPKSFEEPNIVLERYEIEEGFNLQVAVSEPFIEAPVAMDFDNQGRMWIVEMKGYMKNLQGIGDEMPNGVISIVEDLDKDGIADHSKIFLDSLVLPRAIAHVYGGLLYAEPPMLWFVDIENDKPVNRVLVDSTYADGGNVEHQPNGLMMNIDNWIYNAKSNYRYQRKNGEWLKQETTFRGQWGITKDNFGRLYYNTNSVQLLGDYVLPNTSNKNPYYKANSVLNKRLTPDQRVYPLHPTSVNRGYVEGVLDKDSLLVNVTSACGPLLYRGGNFGASYSENAFVCAPEANLVKRNILNFESVKVTAKQAVPEKEFLASTDEGFRPVNLNNGPDGNMYVVDMHRGILQDKVFLTSYLKNKYAEKKLDTIVGMGRILRVVRDNYQPKEMINIDTQSTSQLVTLLSDTNGWLRDRAQQALILKQDGEAISLLEKIILQREKPLAQIHALYTLKGLHALNFKILETVLKSDSDSEVISHALVLANEFASKENIVSFIKIATDLSMINNPEIDLYLVSSLNNWSQLSIEKLFPIISKISNRYIHNKVYQEAVVSGIIGAEEVYKNYIELYNPNSSNVIYTILAETISNKANQIKKKSVLKTAMPNALGYRVFKNFCATCHGFNGEGVDDLAPPLENSEYIKGSPERLALVLLHGLAGPVHVNGKLYELNGTMPGLANNQDFTDQDIQNIITYLHSTFSEGSKKITAEKIKALREVKPKEGGVYSEKELTELGY